MSGLEILIAASLAYGVTVSIAMTALLVGLSRSSERLAYEAKSRVDSRVAAAGGVEILSLGDVEAICLQEWGNCRRQLRQRQRRTAALGMLFLCSAYAVPLLLKWALL